MTQRAIFLSPDPPEAKSPRPVVEGMDVVGTRMVLNQPLGYVYDLRALGNPQYREGRLMVPLVAEWQWYQWGLNHWAPDDRPEPKWAPAHLVFAE